MRAKWPAALQAPLQPRVLAERGLCARHREPLWTSSRPSDRERAVAICGWCPVLAACRDWSLSLPWADTTVYAGMGSRERSQARKAAQERGRGAGADGAPPAA